jgi:A/G-specific adenine glycosylase
MDLKHDCTPRSLIARIVHWLRTAVPPAGLQERPVLGNKRSQPHYIVTAGVIHKQGRVLIAQRPAHGLLGGLWEFPGGKLQPGEDLASCLQREILEELGVPVLVGGWLGVYRHAYTHFR